MKYRNELPIVYYGSSITQGACASHPGNAYENVISRELGLDFINLGLSGNGKGEDVMVEYLASLPMLAFVSDYDHNAHTWEHLANTHCKLYRTIREKHPDIPYLMITRPDDYSTHYDVTLSNRDVIMETFRYARERGDGNVYYLDGSEIFRGAHEDQCTVDGTHPNDFGFSLMADAIGCALRRMLMQKDI